MSLSRKPYEFVKSALAGITVPIRGGPLRGRRWSITAGKHFVVGDYEPAQTRALLSAVRSGDVVYDIGAHVGYFAVLMAECAGPTGQVHAFEPRPINQRFLRRHLRINGCRTVEFHPWSVGDRTGGALLETRTGTGTGYVSERGDVPIHMIDVDTMVASDRLPPPDFMKIDVEGGEVAVLRGAIQTITVHRPRMMLATHGEDLQRACRTLLEPLGYQFTAIGQLHGDTEFLVQVR